MSIFDHIAARVAPHWYFERVSAQFAEGEKGEVKASDAAASAAPVSAPPRQKRADAPRSVDELIKLVLGNRNETSRDTSREAILAAYHTVPMFHAAADLVAERVAEVDWFATRDGRRIDHPVLDVLQNPNSVHDGYTYRWLQQHYYDLLGESFALALGRGPQLRLLPFPPLSTKRTKNGWKLRHNDLERFVSDREALVIARPDLRDPYGRGSGIGLAAGDEVEISKYAARHEKAEFANFSVPAFVAWVPGGAGKVDDFAELWRDEMVGPDNHGKGMFLGVPTASKPVIQEMSRKMSDMSVRELREFSDKLIRMTWRIPPEMIGDVQNANRATSEHAREFFNENVLRPRLRALKLGLQKGLLPFFDDGDSIELHFDDPRVENRGFMLDVIKEFSDAFTINEIRAVAGVPHREGGDVYLRPGPSGEMEEVPAGRELIDQDGDGEPDDVDETSEDRSKIVYIFGEPDSEAVG